jgi:hypothetical protein
MGAGLFMALLEWSLGLGWGISFFVLFLLGFILKLWIAFQACFNMNEARQAGVVELLLATPLKTEEIIRGQWLALSRAFLFPVLVLVLLQIGQAIAVLVSAAQVPEGIDLFFATMFSGLLPPATLVADCLAMGWVGLWLGMKQKRPSQAFFLTILCVLFVPTLPFCVPDIVLDLCLIYWAHQRLQAQFREMVWARTAPEASRARAPAWGGNRQAAGNLPPVIPTHRESLGP